VGTLKGIVNGKYHIDNNRLFVAFLIVYIALIADISIGNISDIVVDFSVSPGGIVMFVSIAVVFVLGQYFILKYIMNKKGTSSTGTQRISYRAVQVVQYALAVIMIAITLQVVFASSYYTMELMIAVLLSYGMAAILMGALSWRLFVWFKFSKSIATLFYALAAAMITINAIDSLIFFNVVLSEKSTIINSELEVIFQVGFEPGTFMSLVAMIQTTSMVGYFVLTWAGTILLLIHHMKRVGKIKFWILVTLPLIYFMSYYINLYEVTNPDSPVTQALSSNFIIPILLFTYSIALCGILFGIAFYSIARSIKENKEIRIFMLITAYGFVLFFNAADATVLQAGYPPFGLANVSFVGLSAFLIFVGLYSSAISVAKDVQLRSFIKKSVKDEAKFLASIGTAQMQEELEKRIMTITRDKSEEISQFDEISPSLSEDEMKRYLEEVIREVESSRQR
jgi:hypothetical protein